MKVAYSRYGQRQIDILEQAKHRLTEQLELVEKQLTAHIDAENKTIAKLKRYITFPLSQEWRGKPLQSITFVNAKGETATFVNDDRLYIDSEGYPYYYFEFKGFLHYENGQPIYTLNGSVLPADFVGAIEIIPKI